jgi:tRNA(fMet)-specific endonuclease VapC
MSAIYMLDTDISSYIIKENPVKVAEKYWEHRDSHICISVMAYAELLFGAEKKKKEKYEPLIEKFICRIPVIEFTESASLEYAKIRNELLQTGNTISNMDKLIAAHARSLNAVLVTNNVRHFSVIEGLAIENWCE